MATATANLLGNSSGLEERVVAFIDEILVVDAVEDAFNQFLIHNPALEQFKWERRLTDWLKILSDCANANPTSSTVANSTANGSSSSDILQRQVAADPALRHFVARAAACTHANPLMLSSSMKLLETAVHKKALNARQVCDALLYSEYLKYDKPEFWLAAFGVVRRVISTIDYKGVREIMKNCIDKVLAFPTEGFCEENKYGEGRELSRQMNAAKDLLAHIFDRNSALLPGYFIVNEILKSYPENPTWPHKHLVPLVSDFLNSFRHPAQMVSSVLRHRMRPVVEQNGKAHAISSWKMDPHSLKFLLKQTLTYEKVLPFSTHLCEPQTALLRYILKQPYSKDLVNSVLGVQKPRKDASDSSSRGGSGSQYPMLEEQLVLLFVEAIEQSDKCLVIANANEDTTISSQLLARTQIFWWSLCSELIFFLLYQFVSFSSFIDSIYKILIEKGRKELAETTADPPLIESGCSGRDELMWALLQYISGSIAKNTVTDFLPVRKLFFLYDEPEPLPVPDVKSKYCARQLAAAAIYIHLQKKAQPMATSDGSSNDSSGTWNALKFSPPIALRKHYEFLKSLARQNITISQAIRQDYQVPIILNTFSTDQNIFTKPMSELVAAIAISSDGGGITANDTMTNQQPQTIGESKYIAMPGNNCYAHGATEPLPMDMLDAMSVHAKMSLTHSIVTHILKHVNNMGSSASGIGNNKSVVYLSPAVVETYSRLMVYSEIESLGIKGFLNQLLPVVFKHNCWGVLHMLLEMFAYRLHHIQAQFRLSLLSHLQLGLITGNHSVMNKHPQLQVCVESTILRLITGLGNAEIAQPKNQPPQLKSTNVLYGESEELNRVVVLTLARAIHINGLEQQSSAWVKEVLTNIMEKTPHSWPSQTLQSFPLLLQEFFKENPGPKNNKKQLSSLVEEEYKLYESMSKSMSNEQDIVQHFCEPSNTLFLCVLWQMLLEKDEIQPTAYKVLQHIGAKQLTSHLRSFCDMLVCEFSKSGQAGHVNKCIDAMNNLIWKYNIIALEKLILCMALRTHEGSEAQVCFFIIQLLLLKPKEFRCRVIELEKTMSPEHHLIKDFHSKHMELHQKYPEKFHPDSENVSPSLPTYFGNVCLRFIPVFDIVVHRFLELPPVSKSLETLIDHMGVLYKFHDRPISYLYNTLHYYELRVRDRAMLKKKLISNIVGALKDVRPPGWCLTEQYNEYLMTEGTDWRPETPDHGKISEPGLDYYVQLVGRFARTISESNSKSIETGATTFPFMDWRFNEFPNEGAHALYVTCVEIMGLPSTEPAKVGGRLLDVVLDAHHLIGAERLPDWINAIGLLLSSLPDVYSEGLTQRLVNALISPPLSNWNLPQSVFQILNFDDTQTVFQGPTTSSTHIVHLLALSHSVWHHSGISQIQQMPDMVRDKLIPVVRTEEQLIFAYHLVGPFLQRLHSERCMRPLFDITINLYKMLAKVDKETQIKNIDAICDILYHVKYQFTGDTVKLDAEKVVMGLRPELQIRLKFIAPGISLQVQQNQKEGQNAVMGNQNTFTSSFSGNHVEGGPSKKARLDSTDK